MKKYLTAILVSFVTLSIGTQALASSYHIVKRNDTMWKISQSYNVTLADLIRANPQVDNPDLIYPRERLEIPSWSGADSDSYDSNVANQILSLVNLERSKQGLSSLSLDSQLSKVAQIKAEDMANRGYFSHDSPTYGSPFDMMQQFGVSYRSAGENIAQGQQSPQAVMNAWMNSSGHRANILGDYTHLGVGHVAEGNYWVQMFISK